MPRKVCVLGGDHENTLGTIRCLRDARVNFDLIVLSPTGRSFVTRSNCVRRSRIIRELGELGGALTSFYGETTSDEKPILIFCHDGMANFVDCDARLRRKFIVPSADGGVSKWMDKALVNGAAERAGFRIPQTLKLATDEPENVAEIFPENLYPCIVKPAKSCEGSKNDFAICGNAAELAGVLSRFASSGQKFAVAQEFLDVKKESVLLGCRTEDGRVFLAGEMLKLARGFEINNLGLASLLRTGTKNDAVLTLCTERLLHEIDFRGIFSIDLLTTDQSKYFCEINLRTDANIYFACAAGTNLPALWCGGVSSIAEKQKNLICMHEISHAKNRLKRGAILQLCGDLMKTDVFSIFSLRDPKPMAFKILNQLCK